jgi:hypothetical protein
MQSWPPGHDSGPVGWHVQPELARPDSADLNVSRPEPLPPVVRDLRDMDEFDIRLGGIAVTHLKSGSRMVRWFAIVRPDREAGK